MLQLLLEAHGAVVPTEQLLEKARDEMADPFTTTGARSSPRAARGCGVSVNA